MKGVENNACKLIWFEFEFQDFIMPLSDCEVEFRDYVFSEKKCHTNYCFA